MNTLTYIATGMLLFLAFSLGTMLLTGRIKIVRVQPKGEDDPRILSLHLGDSPIRKRKRGRPSKDTDAPRKPRSRHVYLPPGITTTQVEGLSEFFRKNQSALGDKVVLHITSPNGPEQTIEVPGLVRWNSHLQENLATALGGWS